VKYYTSDKRNKIKQIRGFEVNAIIPNMFYSKPDYANILLETSIHFTIKKAF
jgi:hypothetical protein